MSIRGFLRPARARIETWRQEHGQGMVEYALIIAVIGVGSIAGLVFLRDDIKGLFSKAGSSIRLSADAVSGPTAPEAPTITSIDPAEGSEGSTDVHRKPTFTFEKGARTDSLECRLDAADFTPCTSPLAYAEATPLAPGDHSFSVRGVNSVGAGPEAVRSWKVVIPSPSAPTITSVNPAEDSSGNTAAHRTPAFEFTPGENTDSLECRFDDADYQACTSPLAFSGTPLAPGDHSFSVRGVNEIGHGPDAKRSWKVVIPSPSAPTITSVNPAEDSSGNTAAHRTPAFEFTPGENTDSLECRFDDADYQACTSPLAFSGTPLAPGDHSFSVRGVNEIGHGPEAKRSWTVTVMPPAAPTITSVNPAQSSSGNGDSHIRPTFTFVAAPNTDSLECRFDAADYAACTSPLVFSGTPLGVGSHSFSVRGVNAGGPGVAAVRSWTVTAPTAGPVSISCAGGPISFLCDDGDNLTATLGSGWSGVVTYTYQWQHNPTFLAGCSTSSGWVTVGGNSPNLPGTAFSISGLSDPVRVRVTGSNGSSSTATVTECTNIAVNTPEPPSGGPVTLSPTGVANIGTVLTASTVNEDWSYEPTEYTFRFQQGPNGIACASVGSGSWSTEETRTATPPASSVTYTTVAADGNYCWRVTLVARNGEGNSSTVVSTGTVFINPPPSPPTAGNVSLDCPDSSCEEGELITANPGTWGGNPAPTLSYQWQHNTSPSSSCSASSGWTNVGGNSPTLTLPDIPYSGVNTDSIRVIVTGTNGVGAPVTACATARFDAVSSLPTAPPGEVHFNACSGTCDDEESISATTNGWGNGPIVGYSWTWEQNSSDTAGCSNTSGWSTVATAGGSTSLTSTRLQTPNEISGTSGGRDTFRVSVRAWNADGQSSDIARACVVITDQ